MIVLIKGFAGVIVALMMAVVMTAHADEIKSFSQSQVVIKGEVK